MPSTSNFVLSKGYTAAAAITIYRAVKFSAEETVTPVTAKTDVVAGVAAFGVSAAEILKGKLCSVATMGACEMEVGGGSAATVGSMAGLNADGTVHNAATGDRVIGEIRQGGPSGGRCSVQLNLPGFLAP